MRKTQRQLDPTNRYREDRQGRYPFNAGTKFLFALQFAVISIAALVLGSAWRGIAGLVIVFFFVGLPMSIFLVARFGRQIMEGEIEEDSGRVRRATRNAWLSCAAVGLLILITVI